MLTSAGTFSQLHVLTCALRECACVRVMLDTEWQYVWLVCGTQRWCLWWTPWRPVCSCVWAAMATRSASGSTAEARTFPTGSPTCLRQPLFVQALRPARTLAAPLALRASTCRTRWRCVGAGDAHDPRAIVLAQHTQECVRVFTIVRVLHARPCFCVRAPVYVDCTHVCAVTVPCRHSNLWATALLRTSGWCTIRCLVRRQLHPRGQRLEVQRLQGSCRRAAAPPASLRPCPHPFARVSPAPGAPRKA
jgi:hypothetical protein